MKKLLGLIIVTILMSQQINAQDCEFYFPQDKGMKIETTSYDKKGKETGKGLSTILDKNQIGNAQVVKVSSEYKSSGSDSVYRQEYTVKCENGEFFINMDTYLDQKSLEAYKNMEITVDADQMTMPANLTAGQVLNNGRITAKISNGGINLVTINVLITNRKVEGFEKVTTPAGTFDCVKISYEVETKMMFKIKMSGIQWFAKNIGAVKTETYDKKGKLEGSTLITKITK